MRDMKAQQISKEGQLPICFSMESSFFFFSHINDIIFSDMWEGEGAWSQVKNLCYLPLVNNISFYK